MVDYSQQVGWEGKLVARCQLRERLERELEANVALGVTPNDDDTTSEVSGRSELYLAIPLGNMRREGIVNKLDDDVRHKPYEKPLPSTSRMSIRVAWYKTWAAVVAISRT